MEIKTTKNIVYQGSTNRSSLLDVYSPQKGGKFPAVIFVHGFKGFKDWGHFPFLLQSIAENGFHVVSFNLSHNGGTVESPIDFPDLTAFSENTYSKELNDVEQIISWVKTQSYFEFSFISIIGHSRGGGIAVLAASRNVALEKLVTWAAVHDFVNRLPDEKDLLEWKKRGVYYIRNGRTMQDMPMNYEFVLDLKENSKALSIPLSAKRIDIPTLIIHGENDEAVSVESARSLNKKIKNSKIELIKNSGHTFGGSHPFNENELPKASIELLNKTIEFLKF